MIGYIKNIFAKQQDTEQQDTDIKTIIIKNIIYNINSYKKCKIDYFEFEDNLRILFNVFRYCGLDNDKQFIIDILNIDKNRAINSVLEYISKELLEDKNFLLQVIECDHHPFHVREELRAEKSFILSCLSKKGWALIYASEDLRDDEEVVLEAVKKSPGMITEASERLQNDKQFILKAVEKNCYVILNLGIGKFLLDNDVISKATKNQQWDFFLLLKEEVHKYNQLKYKYKHILNFEPPLRYVRYLALHH